VTKYRVTVTRTYEVEAPTQFEAQTAALEHGSPDDVVWLTTTVDSERSPSESDTGTLDEVADMRERSRWLQELDAEGRDEPRPCPDF
jgi:hypothetical protein